MNLSRLLRALFSSLTLRATDVDPGGNADDQRQTDAEIKQAIDDRNSARLKMYDDIADSNDEGRAEEFAEVPDDAHERFQPKVDEDVDTQVQSPQESQKISLKVNGKVVELPLEEVIARAQKVESADQYLSEASRIRTDALRQQNPTPSPDTSAQLVEDDLALVRAIQMGSEEEAVQAIRKLKTPSVKPDELGSLIDERMSFQTAVSRFQTEYTDIFSDPILRQVALSKDAELVAQGDGRPYWDRYQAIGNEVREWVGTVRKEDPVADKQQRKASVTQITPAASRVASQPQEEPDESVSDVIANMAKTRGQVR
jgi:hypothetical protein